MGKVVWITGRPSAGKSTLATAIAAELREAFDRVLRSGRFVLGAEVERLERSLAERIGVDGVVRVSHALFRMSGAAVAAHHAANEGVPGAFLGPLGRHVRSRRLHQDEGEARGEAREPQGEHQRQRRDQLAVLGQVRNHCRVHCVAA